MALYHRISQRLGKGPFSISINEALTSISQVMHGEIADSDVSDRFKLSKVEESEFKHAKLKFITEVSEMQSALIDAGVDMVTANKVAQSTLLNRMSVILMKTSLGYSSQDVFESELGI